VDRLKTSEAKLSAQAEAHKAEVEDLKKLAEMSEKFEVAMVKHEISEIQKSRAQKNAKEVCDSKERCYEISLECAKNLKNNFAKVGAYSSEQRFIRGDPDGVVQWRSRSLWWNYKWLGRLLRIRWRKRGRDDLKAVCEHVKAAAQLGFVFLADDTKDPSAEASSLGEWFYSDVWMKGGREMADEAIRKNKKESHDAQEEAKRAKEALECARLIGTFSEV
jgi:hypothetical protein